MSRSSGYLHIPKWDTFQHPDAKRRAAPGMAWIKNYTGLLDNPNYFELSVFDRGVLHALWIMVARTGQDRCSASATWLAKQCNVPQGHMQRSMKRLNHAGFIEVVASRAQATRLQVASPEEEGSKEPLEEKKSARARRDAKTFSNGNQPHPAEDERPLTREQRRQAARAALELVQSQAVKTLD